MFAPVRVARIITRAGVLTRPTVEHIDAYLRNRAKLHRLTRADIDRLLDARLQLTSDKDRNT